MKKVGTYANFKKRNFRMDSLKRGVCAVWRETRESREIDKKPSIHVWLTKSYEVRKKRMVSGSSENKRQN